MGMFGSTSTPSLLPYLNMAKESVTNAEGEMGNYDKVVDDFSNMTFETYNESQAMFGPWQERMNNIFMQTDANSYATERSQTFNSQLSSFNKRANDKFFKAGLPSGGGVGSQRGVGTDIMKAQYEAQNDFSAKHEVARIHDQAMQTGDASMKASFNQMTAGIDMQQSVSDMYASNAANEMSYAMSTAQTNSNAELFNVQQNLQKENQFMSMAGTAVGYGVSAYGASGSTSNNNTGQGPTVANAQGMNSMQNTNFGATGGNVYGSTFNYGGNGSLGSSTYGMGNTFSGF